MRGPAPRPHRATPLPDRTAQPRSPIAPRNPAPRSQRRAQPQAASAARVMSAAPSAAAAHDVGTLSGLRKAIADEAPTAQLPCPPAAAAAALDVATTSRFRHTGQVERTPVAHWCTTGAEDGVGRGGCIFQRADHVRPSLMTPPSTAPAVPDLGTTDVEFSMV
ncbi:hypothetical protein PLICRDRAFT_173007 [Plicaturopsis crispa FD-325 SS-3]|nr:hypothetical protein PLICRDRAFT_173007 [Plicaturopsis crispa FD-325 SS-3]